MNNITKNHSRTILAGALSAALMFAAGGAMAQETTQEHEATTQQGVDQVRDHDRADHDRIQTSRDLSQDRDRTMGDEDGDVDGGVFDRDSDQPVNDTWITTKVKSSLLADSDVAGTEVDVETINGVVHLSGYVDDQRQIDRAVEIARDIEGVTSVESSGLQLKASDTD